MVSDPITITIQGQKCYVCGRILPIDKDYFQKSTNSESGFEFICRACRGKGLARTRPQGPNTKTHKHGRSWELKQLKERVRILEEKMRLLEPTGY
jgi:hypothetical protein